MNQASSSKDDTIRLLEQQLQESRAGEKELQIIAGELQTQKDDANRRAEAFKRIAEASNRRAELLQTQVNDANRRAELLQPQIQHAEDRVQHFQRSLAETAQELRQCEDRLQAKSTHWVVRREEIELTGPELGVGAWTTITVAKFRGTQVAVKKMNNQLISHHNLLLFQREINMTATLHHPNLIQFIGATLEGEMLIIMELMATSLRSQLQREMCFQPPTVKAISLDVARGLNYLHLILPDPIVHRNIDSSTVLLEVIRLDQWRAKLGGYATVNIVHQLHIPNPGSPFYTAPEASNPLLQSPKMDIYSFGALLLEMLTGQPPAPDDRPVLLHRVQHEQLLHLIKRCLNDNKEDRPSANEIISELTQD